MTRLLTLLLFTQATAEWVEISQQHYRKPLRTHSSFTTPDKVIHVEDTTKPWTNNNRSVTEHNWNKNPARPPKIGNVNRMQHGGSTTKTIDRVKEDDDNLDLHVDFRGYELRPNLTRAAIELHDKQKGMIERVPNVGNIKRVQLNNSPVKSPVSPFKGDREQYSHNRHDNNQHDNDDDDDEANDFEHKKNTEAFRRIYLNKIKHPHGTERTATFSPDDDDDSSFTEEISTYNTEKPKQKYMNHTKVRDFYSTKPTFITESGDFTNYESEQDRFYKITNSKSSEVTDQMNIFTTEILDTDDVTKMSSKGKPTATKDILNNVHKNMNDFNAESHENNVQVSRNDENTANPTANDHKTKITGTNNEPKQDHELEKENIKDKKGKSPTATSINTKAEKNKVNTMENVIKFMRVVADTISKNSRRSFSGKMQYLHELKESILANIEQRIDATWPDDDSAGARRRSRSTHTSPRGHVQFPSSESALMTISFLTFAVFLIKLVLQVIQTYKHKAMMVAPLMVASGRNVFTHQGHH